MYEFFIIHNNISRTNWKLFALAVVSLLNNLKYLSIIKKYKPKGRQRQGVLDEGEGGGLIIIF
jgi:hypothetical protein